MRLAFVLTGAAASLALAASTAVADTTPQPLPFSQDWTNTGLITTTNDWSGVPGVIGYRGDGLAGGSGTDPQTVTADGSATPVNVNANQTNGAFATGGVTEFQLTNPTVGIKGSGTAKAPHLVIAVKTTGVANVRVRYDLRDLDGSASNSIQPIALEYRVGNTGAFTNVPAAFVADASTGPSMATQVTAVDVVLPADAGNQAEVDLRIITTDAAGTDEYIGVDDLLVADASSPPSAVGVSTPGDQIDGQAVGLTATTSPGAFPTSASFGVVCDLTPIGGAASQAFFDDASNGDVTAGDGVFSFTATISATAAAGAKSLACVVTDDQSRHGNFTIAVTVDPVCGDGRAESGEGCDDGGHNAGDGCSPTCTVETGYACTGSPSVCADLDECATGTDDCDPHATCANTTGGFTCTCTGGFTGTGVTCTDIDECAAGTDDCVATATCTNTDGSFTCDCGAGYTGDGRAGGTACTDIDECAAGTAGCDPHASCTNTDGGFTCACDPGFSGSGTTCAALCGDSMTVTGEACDDGGTTAGDGCDASCQVEPGWTCSGMPSVCMSVCGDGMIVGGERCDDGGTAAGDGCDAGCQVELGYQCTGTPSVCASAGICGDGHLGADEQCDDGNTSPGDGCSASCRVEPGHTCDSSSPSVCEAAANGGGCCSSSNETPLGGPLVLAIAIGLVWRRRRPR